MDMIRIELDGDEYEFPHFRATDIFESFEYYIANCLLGVYTGPRTDVITQRCLLSGFPVAQLLDEEIVQMIKQAVFAHKLDRFDSQLKVSEEDHKLAFTLVWAHIESRMIDSSKPAPSVSFSRDRLALAHQPWDRQLSILLSTLLFDSGMFREKNMDYATRHARIRATHDLADMIGLIDSYDMVDELHSALIELDAKYAIRTLTFTSKEKLAIENFRNAEYIDFDELLPAVLAMIAYRDNTMNIVEDESGSVLWTREVYASRTFEAVDRESYSNIFKLREVGGKPANPRNPDGTRIKNPNKRGPGRPKAPLTPEKKAEQAIKEERKSAATSAFDAIFGVGFGKKA